MTVFVINVTDIVLFGLGLLLAASFAGAMFLVDRADRKKRR